MATCPAQNEVYLPPPPGPPPPPNQAAPLSPRNY